MSLLILACIYCASCSKPQEELQKAGIEIIKIPESVQENNAYNIKDLFTDVEIIPLETTDKSLLRSSTRIFMGDFIYYLNERNTVSIFDREGNFLKSLREGDGPGELNRVMDFQIAENGDLLTMEYLIVSRFTAEGEFIREYRVDQKGYDYINPKSFCWFSEDNYYLWVIGSNELAAYENEDCFHLHHVKDARIDSSMFKTFSWTFGSSHFLKSSGKYYASPPDYGNRITEISEQGMNAKYFIDFGSNNVDTAQLKYGFNRQVLMDNFKTLGQKFSYGISDFMDTGDYYYFKFVHQRKFRSVFFHKTTGEVFSTVHDVAVIDGLLPFKIIGWDEQEQKILAILEPEVWFDYREGQPKELKETGLLDSIDIAILKARKTTDNPYLIKINLK